MIRQALKDAGEHPREVLLAALIIAFSSIYPLFTSHQNPLYVASTTTLATYKLKGDYSYVAELEHNTFYNNETLITGGERLLYTPIVRRLNVSFEYDFLSSSRPENLRKEVSYSICMECEGRWVKILGLPEACEYMCFTEDPFSISLNVFNITELFDRLSTETGIGAAKRSIKVSPVITMTGIIEDRYVREVFEPELVIVFDFNEKVGKYISLEGLHHERIESISFTELDYKDEVDTRRDYTVIFSSTAFSGLVLASVFYIQSRPERSWTEQRNSMIKEFEEMLIRTPVDPVRGLMIHPLASMDELVRVSEFRMKPIMLYEREKTLKFYLLDDNQKYQFLFGDGDVG